jgi:hypothetical protein
VKSKFFDEVEVRSDAIVNELQVDTAALDGDGVRGEGKRGICAGRLWLSRFLEPSRGEACDELGVGAKEVNDSGEGLVEGVLIVFAQEREEFVADTVALDVEGRVRGVFTETDFPAGGVGEKSGFGLVQQRPNQLDFRIGRGRAGPFHPGEALTA